MFLGATSVLTIDVAGARTERSFGWRLGYHGELADREGPSPRLVVVAPTSALSTLSLRHGQIVVNAMNVGNNDPVRLRGDSFPGSRRSVEDSGDG